MLPPSDLNAIKLAITKHLKVEEEPPEGLYPFGHIVELRVSGAAKKGKPTFAKPTVKLPLLDILAVVVAKAGIAGPYILKLIKEAAAEAQAADKKISDYLETTKRAVRTVEDELIAGMTQIERKGSFTGAVEVEVVNVTKL